MSSNVLTDLHQHVLWGLDDGPTTPKIMHKMLKQAASDGIGLIAATTHAYPEMRRFDMALYRQRLAEANAYCAQRELPLMLMEGCEIHYCDAVPDLLREEKLPTLGGSRCVLVEFSDYEGWEKMEKAADSLFCAGYQPMIAHVERIRALVRSPREAMQLREEYNLLYQVDCEAVLRPHGWFQRCFVQKMMRAQAIDVVATDAHDARYRPIRMREAYRRLVADYGADYADILVRSGWQMLSTKGVGGHTIR